MVHRFVYLHILNSLMLNRERNINKLSLLSAYQVNKRHNILKNMIGVKDEEITSCENINTCLLTVTVCVCSFSILEVASYFLYLHKVLSILTTNT